MNQILYSINKNFKRIELGNLNDFFLDLKDNCRS